MLLQSKFQSSTLIYSTLIRAEFIIRKKARKAMPFFWLFSFRGENRVSIFACERLGHLELLLYLNGPSMGPIFFFHFLLAFSHFCSRFHVSARVFMFRLAFSHFGSRFHVSARVFTFRLAFSRFGSRFHVSARSFMFRLTFSCFGSLLGK